MAKLGRPFSVIAHTTHTPFTGPGPKSRRYIGTVGQAMLNAEKVKREKDAARLRKNAAKLANVAKAASERAS